MRKHLHKFLVAGIYIVCCTNLLSCSAQNTNQEYSLILEKHIQSPEWVYELYIASVDGSSLHQLIRFNSSNLYWLSPDNTYIAIFSPWDDEYLGLPAQSLIIKELLTGKVIGQVSDVGYLYPEIGRLYMSVNSVVWAPESDRLVYEKRASNGSGNALWVYDIGTNSNIPLTDGQKIDRNAAWSPNGSFIAFASGHRCHEETPMNCPAEESYWDIVVVNVESGFQHSITNFANTDLLPQREEVVALCNLLWSPNGEFIAFENGCHAFSIVNDHAVFIASIDATKVVRVVDGHKLSDAVSNLSYSYVWAPSDNKLYIGYSRVEYLESASGYGGFIIKDIESLEETRTAELLGMKAGMASWSNDNLHVVIFTDRSKVDSVMPGPTLLGSLNDDGNILFDDISARLPYGSCDIQSVYWSPDNQNVAYTMGAQNGVCGDEPEGSIVAIISPSADPATSVVELGEDGSYTVVGWIEIAK